jgi:hypothetical protein
MTEPNSNQTMSYFSVRVWDPVRPPGLNSSVKSLQYAVK